MSDQFALLKKIKNILSDLIYINGVIATELIRITENTAVIRHGEEFLNESSCIQEHNKLNKRIIAIVKEHCNKFEDTASLEKHVLKHDE
ncbi:MAG: hypothetical protein ACFFAN_15480 [Promethearchaeota archaeon]